MKVFLVSLLLIIISSSGYFWLQNNNSSKTVLSAQEKKQAMAKILDRDPIIDAKAPRQWKTYDGKYISFSYPTDANVYKNTPPASILESFAIGILNPRINLTVQVATGASVDDYPAVVLRREDNIYKGPTSLTLRGARGVVFSKDSDGAEKSGFFQENGRIYSIVVSGYQTEDVEEFYDQVYKSIRLF
jgi:hypothetical protein